MKKHKVGWVGRIWEEFGEKKNVIKDIVLTSQKTQSKQLSLGCVKLIVQPSQQAPTPSKYIITLYTFKLHCNHFR